MRIRTASVVSAFAFSPAVVLGNDTAPPRPSAGVAIEEIVVTAQKRETSLQDTPLSISAVRGELLEDGVVRDAAGLQFLVPNMSVSEQEGRPVITIRGVGVNALTGATEQAVAVHVDGVYQPRATTGLLGIRDAERVEVVRGPQGTLYGRNATGGAINFVLRKPTDEFESNLKLGVASFETVDFLGVVSGRVVPGFLNARLVGEFDDTGGTIDNLALGKKANDRGGKGGRLALSVFPFADFTADLSVLYREDDGVAPAPILIDPNDPENEAQVGIFPPTVANPDDFVTGDAYAIKENRDGIGEIETTNGSLDLVWDLGSVRVKSVSGFQDHSLLYDFENDSTNRTIFHEAGWKDSSRSVMQEIDVSGSHWRIDWLVGGFFFDEHYRSFLPVDIPLAAGGAGLFLIFDGDEHIRSLAAFGDATLSVTDSIRLFGGVRYSHDRKEMLQSDLIFGASNLAEPAPATLLPSVSCENLRTKDAFEDVSPRYGVQWDVTESIMLYAQRSAGFKSGGTNFTACGNRYDPETIDSNEVGAKSAWFDGALVANVSLFSSDYQNYQVFITQGLEGLIVNAESASTEGAELEVGARPLAGLSIDVGVAWLDAVYEEFRTVDNIEDDTATEQDVSGHELNRAPDYTVNVGVGYEWPIPLERLGKLRLQGNWFHTDEIFFRPFDHEHDKQEAYSLTNAFVSATDASEAYELRFFGKNLEDTRYFTTKYGFNFGNRHGSVGSPRVFGGELVVRF